MKENRKFKIIKTFDKELVKSLHKKIFPEDAWPEDESIDWLVVTPQGHPVGFCMLAPWEKSVTTAYLLRAGLLKDAWGYGLHMRMIRTREREARALGFERLISYTVIENIQSSCNLERAGYRLYVPAKVFSEKTILYWQKFLKKI